MSVVSSLPGTVIPGPFVPPVSQRISDPADYNPETFLTFQIALPAFLSKYDGKRMLYALTPFCKEYNFMFSQIREDK